MERDERTRSIQPAGVMAMACTHRRPDATREAPAVIAVGINWQLARDRPGRLGWRRGPYYRRGWVTPAEGRGLSLRRTQEATQDMGIDDESSHPELCSEVAGGVTRNLVCLFREPDAGNLPVRFDEREQETELRQTGLRRVCESTPTATGRLKPLRLFSTLLAIALSGRVVSAIACSQQLTVC